MQSLSFFHPKVASFTTPYLDSHHSVPPVPKRNRRKKCSSFGASNSSNGSCFPIYLAAFSRGNGISLRNLFFDSLQELETISLRTCSAVSVALQHEPVLNLEKSEEEEVSLESLAGSGICRMGSGNGKREKKVMKLGRSERNRFVEKGGVGMRLITERLIAVKNDEEMEEVLDNLGDLPLPFFSSVIKAFGGDRRVEPAFAIVEWLKRKGKETNGALAPNLFIYNSLLSVVKQAQQFEKVGRILEDMKADRIVPNIVTYNTLMAVYLEQGRYNDALDVLSEIQKNELSPTIVTYTTVLMVYKKMYDALGALGFFENLRDKYQKGEIGNGCEHDCESEFVKLESFIIRICHVVMRQLLVSEKEPAAEVINILAKMDNARVRSSRVDYERLVWACTHQNHCSVALELYKRIREMDNDLSLSVCNHVIWLMGKAKRWWTALEIYEDLLDKGPRPNNLSYELVVSHFNILLSAARRKGIWRWGVRLLNKMQEKGLKPGSKEWNSVLVACSKASETSAAVQIFTRMVEQGEKPTILSYGALLSALEKGKLYDEAIRVWEHMCKVGVKPNLHAYTILISVYIGKGSPDMVDSIFHEMKSTNIEPTVVTYNAIITGCARNNLGAAALEWFNRMVAQNIRPNEITYNILVEALARDGKPRLACDMFQKARNEGLYLSSKSYDVLIETCEAYGTTIDLKALGPRPVDRKKNTRIYRNISDFCNFADVPMRSKPFQRKELSNPLVQEGLQIL